jgi:hypothetical protein
MGIHYQNVILGGPLNTGGSLAHVPGGQITLNGLEWSKFSLQSVLFIVQNIME